jgi:hypothetical protein
MRFSDTSTKTGMIQMCEDLCGFDSGDISGNANLLRRFTRLMNDRYGVVSNKVWKASGDWQFDDKNQTTLPSATTTLVANQQDYQLPSTAQKIERVEVMNVDGNYIQLRPFDESEIEGTAMSEWYKDAGMPVYYDLKGESLILYPKPGAGYVTLAAGLKIYVSRNIVQFNSTATTQEPGFAINFHRLLPIGASIDYAVGKGMDALAKNCIFLWQETDKDLGEFYSRRHRDPVNQSIKVADDTHI